MSISSAMLQTVVISFAVLVSLAILGLMFYVAHQRDQNLRRRVRSAEAGGRPLDLYEQAAVDARRLQPRDAETRKQFRAIWLLGALYIVVFAVVVSFLGLPLALITMYLLAMAFVGVYALSKRRTG
jgi:hypothetical protein